MSKIIYYSIIALSLMHLSVLVQIPEFNIDIDWLLLGVSLGVDSTNYLFAIVSALVLAN